MRYATPARPTRDILQYLLDPARLDDWQADCLSIVARRRTTSRRKA
jgi:spore cortex formation protein SpoVR/YcgB (stage V sporulation)